MEKWHLTTLKTRSVRARGSGVEGWQHDYQSPRPSVPKPNHYPNPFPKPLIPNPPYLTLSPNPNPNLRVPIVQIEEYLSELPTFGSETDLGVRCVRVKVDVGEFGK